MKIESRLLREGTADVKEDESVETEIGYKKPARNVTLFNIFKVL